MRSDPMDKVNVTDATPMPPARGPGSGKSAWVEYAWRQTENGAVLWDIINGQSATIRDLQAEVKLLRKQIATRKPKVGRPRLDDKKVAQIEFYLAAGQSRREVGSRCGVSAMTVTRVARRVAARGALAD